MQQIAHVELHDARVRDISLAAGGVVRVGFDHICLYFHLEHERFEVWSVRATLQLENVDALDVRGAFQGDDYVSEGSLVDDRGGEIAQITPDGLKQAKRCNLLFAGSGSEVHVSMGAASFVLEALLERLEDWNGPLVKLP
jgi:hypothetical protein